MTPPPILRVTLCQAATTEAELDVTLVGPIQRSIGTTGDPVTLRFRKGDWPALFDIHQSFQIKLDAGSTSPVTLRGYRLRARYNTDFGQPVAGGDFGPYTEEIVLDTEVRFLREGRGGLLTAGLLNPVNEDGLVDTEASTYRTTQELVDLALDALGVEHVDCPADVNFAADGETVIDAPGPLDWGNQRPITEIEGLLFRVGYTLAFGIDATLRVVRLPRAGEPIDLDESITGLAEPWEANVGPGIRGQRILVTSGATRTTVITERTLSDLEWVAYDERTNSWLNQADFDVLYPGEIGPADLTAFRSGLTGSQMDPQTAKQFAQVFSALALRDVVDDEEETILDKTKCSMFVNIPSEVAGGALSIARGAPGVVEARCVIDMGSEQFVNVPAGAEDPLVRIEGLKAFAREGVFLLPGDAVYARVSGGRTGRRADLDPLGPTDLNIVFAHESNEGDVLRDYAVFGFVYDVSGPEPALLYMDDEETELAIVDPEVVKVAAPFLRRVITRTKDSEGEWIDTPLNDTTLRDVAAQIAWARIADAELSSAVIPLRGLVAVSPGDEDGQISRVVWDLASMRTWIFINQHERPGSIEEQQRKAVGDSIAAGVGALQLGRSAASLGDVRTQMTADRFGAGGLPGSPAANATQRGLGRSMAGTLPAKAEGPQPGEGLRKISELTRIKARLNPAEMPPTSIGDHRWAYDWVEVALRGEDAVSDGATRKSSTHGKALNLGEMFNASSGLLGNGVDTDNIPAGWSLAPIGPRVVDLEGPYPSDGGYVWYFSATNLVDGACPDEEVA